MNRKETSELGHRQLTEGSPERFGFAWERYGKILAVHEEQFRLWTTGMDKDDWSGKWVLDVGCGIGRNSYWAAIYGAAGGLAIDADERTLAHCRRNLSAFPSIEVRYQSIYDLIEESVFDLVFSIGVIDHLSCPDAAVKRMVAAAKPGGLILLWVYGRENNGWIIYLANPLRKALFSRLPLPLVHWFSLPLTIALWIMLKIGIRPGEYFRLISRFSFNHLRAIVFDHMLPRISVYYTREEATGLLCRADLEDVRAYPVNGVSWTVIGRRPMAPTLE